MTIIEAVKKAIETNSLNIIRARDMERFGRRKLHIRVPDGKTEIGPLISTSSAYYEGIKIPRWNPYAEDILADDWIIVPSDDVRNEIQ